MRSSARERMLCMICHARIPVQPFCSECGNPTAYASREERIELELEKWGRAQNRPSPDRVIDLAALEKPVEPPRRKRRVAPERKVTQPVRHAESSPDVAPIPDAPRERGKRSVHVAGRKEDRWQRALTLLPDEAVAFTKEGRCGPERATLVITRYRVAVVQGSNARWIPLETHRLRIEPPSPSPPT